MNHYNALEVPQSASQEEIKKAYRRLAKKYHPDINPTEEARTRIRLINEAYEVLSDTASRGLYDLFLEGVPVQTVIEDITPRERYRAEFLRERMRKQRERMEQQIHYKQKFYKYFRAVNVLSFLAALLFSYDYYFDADVFTYPVKTVVESSRGTYVEFENGYKLRTTDEFYSIYSRSESKNLTVHFSGIFYVAKKIKIIGNEVGYRITGSYFVFNNFFSVLLFVSSIIVIGNKLYSDFRLTCGLLSCMILIWLFLLTAPYY